VLIEVETLSIEGFLDTFHRVTEMKRAAGIDGILDNPPDLLERAKIYGIQEPPIKSNGET